MGTSRSCIRNKAQDIIIAPDPHNMTTLKMSQIDSKIDSGISQNDTMNLQKEIVSKKGPDVEIKNSDDKTQTNVVTEPVPQRQKYVNNRTSKLFELTLPVHKNEVLPEDKKVLNEQKSKLETALSSLKIVDNLVNDEVLDSLNICRNVYMEPTINLYRHMLGKQLCEQGFPELFCSFLAKLQKIDLFDPKNKLAADIYQKTKAVAWNFTNVSRDFCIELGKAGAISLLLDNLTRKEFLPSEITEQHEKHMKGCLGILSNMVRLSPDNRLIARQSNAAKLLLDYSKVEFIMLQAKCFIILSFLITEAEISLLENTGSVIRFIINLLSSSLASENGLARGFSTSEILLALNNLALHDKNKLKIVEYGGLAEIAIALNLQHQTKNKSAIQTLAAELTWKLSFMEENRENIKTEKGLIEAITRLKSSAHGKLKTACSGALWETFEGIFEEADDSSDEQQQTTHLKKLPHVMISYQWDVQPRIIQLKQKLQNAGYNVWMDIDQMEGDLLGAMASAVENAVVVLACISQKYKDSTSCRTEATYAYKQNKPILPLIVQQNYTADGWLGAFIGALKYYPLYKDSMVATEFQNIKSEIGERGKVNSPCKDICGVSTTDSSTNQLHSTHNGPAAPSDVSKWTSTQVTDWLKRNKMPEICNSMKNVNGKILTQMYKMSNKAPDFFYSRLERDFKMNNLMQILKFSNLIDELFE